MWERSKDLVVATLFHFTRKKLTAIRAWETTDSVASTIQAKLLERHCCYGLGTIFEVTVADVLGTCIGTIDWRWDETEQNLDENAKPLTGLPLTQEYVAALRFGGYGVVKNITMSVMAQLGGIEFFCLNTGAVVTDERINAPLKSNWF